MNQKTYAIHYQLMEENATYNPAVEYPYPMIYASDPSMDMQHAPDMSPITDMVVQNNDLQLSPTNITTNADCWNQIWSQPNTMAFLYNPTIDYDFINNMMIHCDYSSEDDLRHTANKTMAMGMKRKSMNDLPIEHFSRLSKEELIERVVQLERERQQNHPILESSDDEESLSHVCRWDKCFLSMSTLEELTNHIRITHVGSGKPAYYCEWEFCPRKSKPFLKRHKMHNHMRTHTGERPFECSVEGCDKRFSRLDSLNTHIKTHSNIRPHACPFENCNKAYFHSRSLRKHLKSHETTNINTALYPQQQQLLSSTAAANPLFYAINYDF